MKFLRSLSLMLAMAFFMTAVVPAGAQASVLKTYDMESTEQIGTAFDKFNYAMNVEWDQQNPAFKAHAEKELANSLKSVDAETLQAFTANSFTDAKSREDFLRLVAAMKAQNLSGEEAAAVAQEWAEKGSVGLSFAGNGGHRCGRICKLVTIIIIVIVIRAIVHHDRDDREIVREEEECPEHEYPEYQYSLVE